MHLKWEHILLRSCHWHLPTSPRLTSPQGGHTRYRDRVDLLVSFLCPLRTSSQLVSQAKWRGVLPSSSWILQACGYFEVRILMTNNDTPEPAATWSGVLPMQSLILSDSGWSSVILSSNGTRGLYRTHAWSSVMPLNSSHLEINWVIYLNVSGFDIA